MVTAPIEDQKQQQPDNGKNDEWQHIRRYPIGWLFLRLAHILVFKAYSVNNIAEVAFIQGLLIGIFLGVLCLKVLFIIFGGI